MKNQVELLDLSSGVEDINLDYSLKNNHLELMLLHINGENINCNINIQLFEQSEANIVVVHHNVNPICFNLTIVNNHRDASIANVNMVSVVSSETEVIFNGLIKIHEKAQCTESYLRHNTLCLEGEPNVTSVPSLEIEADNVKASHSATIGGMNRDQLFYLNSRGISKEQAGEMIIRGYLETSLEYIKHEENKIKLIEKLDTMKI